MNIIFKWIKNNIILIKKKKERDWFFLPPKKSFQSLLIFQIFFIHWNPNYKQRFCSIFWWAVSNSLCQKNWFLSHFFVFLVEKVLSKQFNSTQELKFYSYQFSSFRFFPNILHFEWYVHFYSLSTNYGKNKTGDDNEVIILSFNTWNYFIYKKVSINLA